MDVSVQVETDVGFANITDIDKIVADKKCKTLSLFSKGQRCATLNYIDSKSLEKVYMKIDALLKEHKDEAEKGGIECRCE